METLQGMKRTNHCGALRKTDVGQEVVLCGWVSRRRDHGGLIFVDMRDRSGFVQVVFDEAAMNEGTFHKAESLRNEFCIAVRGKIRARSEETINPNIETGEIEVVCAELRILNPSKTPPFYIQDGVDVDEMVRLKYRYLDLRRPEMQKNIILRHRVTKIMRDFFDRNGFLEIETPMLCKSTPEGARDFLVPSRVNPGEFYALPQSPQIFKQILQVAGFEKYFQIVRCFRDEDLRADRQPEFTQLDIEMSFMDQDDILTLMEEMIKELFKKSIGADVPTPFERMEWDTAMDKYGSDKPDLRFDMPLMDISEYVKGSSFKVFNSVIENGGMVKCIKVDGYADIPRRRLDDLVKFVQVYGAKGLAWIQYTEDGIKSPFSSMRMRRSPRSPRQRAPRRATCCSSSPTSASSSTRRSASFASRWARSAASSIRTSSASSGSSTSRCTSGATRSTASRPCTIRSRHRATRTSTSSTRTAWAMSRPRLTIWSSTASRSVAARCVSTTPTCRRRSSSPSASRRSRRIRSSAS